MPSSFALRALVLGLFAVLSACAPASRPRAATVTIGAAGAGASAPVAAGPEALIWSAGEDGKIGTRWLAPDANGYREVAHASELLLTAGDVVWQWSAREVPVPTVACTETNGAPAGEGIGTRAALVRLGPSPETVVVVAPATGGTDNEIHQSVVPVGSVGPYLFVRQADYRYSCGAHGGVAVSALVWDLEGRRPVDILEPAERAAMDTTVRVEAERLFREDPDGDANLEDISYVASLPRYGARGWLRVEHAFTSFACYACSDGVWSSYTRSRNVPAQRLPERVRAYARPAAVVAAYLEKNPDVTIAGWSAVTPAAADVLRRALSAGRQPGAVTAP